MTGLLDEIQKSPGKALRFLGDALGSSLPGRLTPGSMASARAGPESLQARG